MFQRVRTDVGPENSLEEQVPLFSLNILECFELPPSLL